MVKEKLMAWTWVASGVIPVEMERRERIGCLVDIDSTSKEEDERKRSGKFLDLWHKQLSGS